MNSSKYILGTLFLLNSKASSRTKLPTISEDSWRLLMKVSYKLIPSNLWVSPVSVSFDSAFISLRIL